ncbi:conserved oligomeric Golgi complex subunit 2-like isoform X2 [Cervus elaphus]|uniref:conserved oligomeric Golgi complex subunit 2-like isoform X2 n=1 Tax=Cervus elaphus TaxID=9860 RepID=UPI001CC2C8DA|nr:conserved oligomeric Golgi complex subunit 2-like isoform X2 [Cervus elaphus]
MEKSRMNLPKRPDTLCFDKDEFMKEDFDVDHFMSDCRKRVQLEALRDDLELYYKLLKTAMVELINKDYADFVNLSTNLALVLHCQRPAPPTVPYSAAVFITTLLPINQDLTCLFNLNSRSFSEILRSLREKTVSI